MKTIEINEIGKYIDAAPKNMNLMFVGDTGIGKTTAIEKYCEDRGIFLKTLILSQLEASETLGIPVKSQKEFQGKVYDVLSTAIPQWVFELAEQDNAILFLDEFLCAQPSVMNAFLNFLTQKRVQDIDLSHIRIIAATNVGNYTFEPDNNILSRFCWFYAVNSNFNDYIQDDRIINNYVDENEKEGTLFEVRSLKPRCQEQLKGVADEFLLDFYEGFTNKLYIRVHLKDEINDLVAPYFSTTKGAGYEISDESIVSMCAVLRAKYPRVSKWDKIIGEFINISMATVTKIKETIEG